MRFGRENPLPQMSEVRPTPKRRMPSNIFVAIGILIVIALAGWFYRERAQGLVSKYTDLSASPYHAIFLSNGQVYFGKILESNRKEIALAEVYYLQLSSGDTATTSTSAEARFALVKLGQELHGPTDKLFINREHVMFVEQLKSDSKVVQSITNGR